MIEFVNLKDHPEMDALREQLVRQSQLQSPYVREFDGIHEMHAAETVEDIANGRAPNRRLTPNPSSKQYEAYKNIYQRAVKKLAEALELSKTNG